jgi:hypothetical protein
MSWVKRSNKCKALLMVCPDSRSTRSLRQGQLVFVVGQVEVSSLWCWGSVIHSFSMWWTANQLSLEKVFSGASSSIHPFSVRLIRLSCSINSSIFDAINTLALLNQFTGFRSDHFSFHNRQILTPLFVPKVFLEFIRFRCAEGASHYNTHRNTSTVVCTAVCFRRTFVGELCWNEQVRTSAGYWKKSIGLHRRPYTK